MDAAMRFAMRSHGQLLVALLVMATCALPALAAGPALTGHWVLLEDESDDPRDALKGLTLMRQDSFSDEDRRERAVTDQVSNNYYAQRALVEKRRVENAVADVGPIQLVLDARVLDIEDAGATATIRYDTAYTRSLMPTEGGPVYSAKGNEYKTDSLGLELSYRRDGLFVIETMLRPRGRMLEEFKLDPGGNKLTVNTTIDNPDWVIEARLRRVFARNGAE
jgi:hypothetical protein